jgi:hypothetical protein
MNAKSAPRIGTALIFALVITACSPTNDARNGRNDNTMLWILGGILVTGLLVSSASCSPSRVLPVVGGGLVVDPGTC